MLTLDIVNFVESLNFQLMQLTRFEILEFKTLFPLLCFSFCFLFFFCTHEQFTISLKYSMNNRLYINFRSDTYKLFPWCLLVDSLKICKTAIQEAACELWLSSLESGLFPILVFIWLMK